MAGCVQVLALEAEAQSTAALVAPDALEARFAQVRLCVHSHGARPNRTGQRRVRAGDAVGRTPPPGTACGLRVLVRPQPQLEGGGVEDELLALKASVSSSLGSARLSSGAGAATLPRPRVEDVLVRAAPADSAIERELDELRRRARA